MSSLPRKSVTGLPLKKYVLDTLNGLIDYLQTHRIKAGRGIDVRETASGYVIGIAEPPSNPPQVLNAGGGADGIEASVTGGTASVTLTGGTGSVNLVGTGSVTISGNPNGEIEINATGSSGTAGFPDLLTGSSVSRGTNYPVSSDSWLIGHVGIYGDTSLNYPTNLSGYVDLKVSLTATPSQNKTFELYCNQGLYSVSNYGLNEWLPVCIPIKAGYTIRLTVSGSAIADLSLYNT